MAKPTPNLRLDNQLCFALYRASRAVTRSYGPYLSELGLTYPQYLTMLVLWEADAEMSVSEVGARLRLDSGTLTPLLKRLEELGHIARARDEADERRVLISPTPAGRALRRRAAAVPAQVFDCFGIDVDTGRRLLGELTAIAERLEAVEGA